MNSAKYIDLVDEQLKRHAVKIAGTNFIYQQDNASVHTAKIVKYYFTRENMKILEWPARSPDLNIIENCWAHLAKSVYAGGRQFRTFDKLKTCINRNWAVLSRKFVKNYVNLCQNV